MEHPENNHQPALAQAQLILTLDLKSYVLTISGTVPSHEMALSMARLGVDECKRIIDSNWMKANRDRVNVVEAIPLRSMGRG
jgi:hypothetical protein